MELDATQKEAVRKWVAEGCSISEIQKRLSSEFSLSMTYLDVRMLLITLGLEIKEKKTNNKHSTKTSDTTGLDTDQQTIEPEMLPPQVNVKLDRVTKPGYLVNGTVTFSDGIKGQWGIDQFGRVALETAIPGYKPSPEDISEFQNALKQLLEEHGM